MNGPSLDDTDRQERSAYQSLVLCSAVDRTQHEAVFQCVLMQGVRLLDSRDAGLGCSRRTAAPKQPLIGGRQSHPTYTIAANTKLPRMSRIQRGLLVWQSRLAKIGKDAFKQRWVFDGQRIA